MSDSDPEAKLLPCPWCGDPQDGFAGMFEESFAKCSDGSFSINCQCGAIGPGGRTMPLAVRAWNMRASARALIGAVREPSDAMIDAAAVCPPTLDYTEARNIWLAMFDELLAELEGRP